MREVRVVTKVKPLGTGYVMVSCDDASRHWGWGQLPRYVWDSLRVGGGVPDEYVFANECPLMMPILVKG